MRHNNPEAHACGEVHSNLAETIMCSQRMDRMKDKPSLLSGDADISAAQQMHKDFTSVVNEYKQDNYTSQHDYFLAFEKECSEILSLTKRKNSDYAGSDDAFKNFRAIEHFTAGRISLEDGIIVRITDKFQRIVNLLKKEAKVKDEAITDTLRDLAVYSLILKIYIEHKNATKRS